ncbi:MAG TPA: BON domain-containing protein [Burkholderiaceae bacterium]|nr:BON domain-containing protein [Burkholderiaceae bacterium]
MALVGWTTAAEERRNWFDTPFGQALDGAPYCPRPEGPLITESEMRAQAHGRIERGTSCWLAKKCDDSNVFRRDPEVQARVIDALRAEPKLDASSVWVTTERRWITLQGCAGSARLRALLLDRVRAVSGVEAVFDELVVGRAKPRWKVDPNWKEEKNRRGTAASVGGAR